MSSVALFRESSGLAIRMSHLVDGDLPALSGVLDGTIYAQTLPSLVAAHVLAAQPGERVLDMCGAPGSKTTHVATNFLRDAAGSLLVTCERNHGKLSRMARLCTETFGLSCVQPTRADTTKLEEAAEAGTEPSPPLSSSSHTAARGCENSVVGDTATALASASIAADDAWSHRRLQAEAVSQAAGGRTDHAAAHALARKVKLRRKEEQRARDKARWAAEQKAQEERARAALMATEEVHPPTAGKEGREGGCTAGDESQEGSNGRRGGGGANGLRGFATGSFDRVLLDPPCSALGLRPKLLQTSVPRAAPRWRRPAPRLRVVRVYMCGRHTRLLDLYPHARGERGAGRGRTAPLSMPQARAGAAEAGTRRPAWFGTGRRTAEDGAAVRAGAAGVRRLLHRQVHKGVRRRRARHPSCLSAKSDCSALQRLEVTKESQGRRYQRPSKVWCV